MTRLRVVAGQLEQLPLELIEPILVQLRLKDMMDLEGYAGPILKAAIQGSPAWKGIYPLPDSEQQALLTTLYFDIVKPHSQAFQYARRVLYWKPTSNSFEGPDLLKATISEVRHISADDRMRRIVETVGVLFFRLIDHTTTLPTLQQYSDQVPPIWKLLNLTDRSKIHLTESTEIRVDQMKEFLDCYVPAQVLLNKARSEELKGLAELYEANPSRLKSALGPQSRRINSAHIAQILRRASKRTSTCVDFGHMSRDAAFSRYLFRFKHCYLIPYNWCLTLWLKVLHLCPALVDDSGNDEVLASAIKRVSPSASPPSEEIRQCIRVARLGLFWCYRKCPAKECNERTGGSNADPFAEFRQCAHYTWASAAGRPTRRIQYNTDGSAAFLADREFNPEAVPCDPRELQWLSSFTKAVSWMEEAFPDDAREVVDAWALKVKETEEKEARQREVRADGRHARRIEAKARRKHRYNRTPGRRPNRPWTFIP
ncbi:hypothetical protein GQ53DRAFT_837109 [Thozetella sp. PMI_491]|nr:hypothetical protein GQ53DRAFT_837109 [Thozetella sp. PMI_491]